MDEAAEARRSYRGPLAGWAKSAQLPPGLGEYDRAGGIRLRPQGTASYAARSPPGSQDLLTHCKTICWQAPPSRRCSLVNAEFPADPAAHAPEATPAPDRARLDRAACSFKASASAFQVLIGSEFCYAIGLIDLSEPCLCFVKSSTSFLKVNRVATFSTINQNCHFICIGFSKTTENGDLLPSLIFVCPNSYDPDIKGGHR
jgi:hypothetical protein